MSTKYFPPESKAATLKMVHALENALKADITELSWMTEDTKKQALDKLAAHRQQDWISRQVARLLQRSTIVRGDALGNGMRANQFEFTAADWTRSASRSTATNGA